GGLEVVPHPTPAVPSGRTKEVGRGVLAFLRADTRRGARRDDNIDLSLNKFARKLSVAIIAPLRPAIFDRDIAPIDPVEFAQPILKRSDVRAPDCRRSRAEEADRCRGARLLSKCIIRPDQRRHCRTAQGLKEVPPPHVRPLAQEEIVPAKPSALNRAEPASQRQHGMLPDVRFGSQADITPSSNNVRFTPESGQRADMRACPLCANSDRTHCSKGPLLDHLVGAAEQRDWERETECLSRLE